MSDDTNRDNPLRLAAMGIDPNAVLVREPRVLLDTRFIGALHAELRNEFGAEEAGITLLQIGFLHGLQGATEVIEASFDNGQLDGLPAAPPLAIRFRQHPDPRTPGAIEVRGSWPERGEAEARLATDDDCSDGGCLLSAGYTSGWLSAMLNLDILAIESRCSVTGGEACQFIAREEEAWRSLGNERALAYLDALPFEAFRDLLSSRGPRRAPHDAVAREDYESGAAVVQIWGPVMVIPFCAPDEALRALDLIGRDPGTQDVTVIVVDLTGAIVDEAFGAAALEQIVDTTEAMGLETIFGGASSLCEGVIAGLERQPLWVHKDVNEAISAAFQISRAQNRVI